LQERHPAHDASLRSHQTPTSRTLFPATFLAMPAITALLHTENDALRLGRVLETLYPCDEIVIVDHNSSDATLAVGRDYGARVVKARAAASAHQYLDPAGWILCLDPRESLSESLAASLFELKSEWKSKSGRESQPPDNAAFSVFLREETAEGWIELPAAQTRLVTAGWNRWNGKFPANDQSAVALEGELLRFAFP
jgi:hypothetical protein